MLDRTAARVRCEAARPTWDRIIDGFGPIDDYDQIEHLWASDLPAALDELDAKDAEIERLRGALLRIANGDFMGAGSLEIARAALEGRDSE